MDTKKLQSKINNTIAKYGRNVNSSGELAKILTEIVANLDYIIIDWDGKDSSDAAKMAEVKGLLTNIYKANPLALLSVIFKDYDTNVMEDSEFSQIISFKDDDGAEIDVRFYSAAEDSLFTISFVLD